MSDEEVFIGGVTRSWLRARSQNERYAVWKRARSLHSAEGNHLARAIELLGLPYAEPEPLDDGDPLLARMRDLNTGNDLPAAGRIVARRSVDAIAEVTEAVGDGAVRSELRRL